LVISRFFVSFFIWVKNTDMCGYAGVVGACDAKLLHKARVAMLHRGPDATKIHLDKKNSLGVVHNRLAIIDLSKQGVQPLFSRDRKNWIVYNGEIYNYVEVKKELIKRNYSFNTKTDTEVLLYALIEWGIDCLHKITGMFSFCFFDDRKQELTLARDAFGIKPLYYVENTSKFIFASEICGIRAILDCKLDVATNAAYDYLVYGKYEHTKNTFYKNVYRLEPGQYLKYDVQKKLISTIKNWWRPQYHEKPNISFHDACDLFQKEFLNSVSIHLRSDVPMGAALSGGLDSSAIVCAAKHLVPDLKLEIYSFEDVNSHFNEKKWVNIICKKLKTKAHFIRPTKNELISEFPKIVACQNEPFCSPSVLAQYFIFKSASANGSKVILEGQGGDEILGGYHGYPWFRFQSLIERKKILNAIQFLVRWHKNPGHTLSLFFQEILQTNSPNWLYKIARRFHGQQYTYDWLSIENKCSFKWRLTQKKEYYRRRLIENLQFAVQNGSLASLLRHSDRNSMRFSIESRVPFLSSQLANFIYSMPEQYLVGDSGCTKHILRSSLNKIIPQPILRRKDKIGFETNPGVWEDILFNYYFEDLKRWAKNDPIIDYKNFVKTFTNQRNQSRNTAIKWRVLCFGIWMKQNIAYES